MKIKSSFVMILFLLAAGFLAAQEGFVVNEGAQLNYRVDFHEGNNYAWEVVTGFNPATRAGPSEALFYTDSNFSEVGVQWNLAGQYFLMVTETDALGCSNTKALAVNVTSNSSFIGFDVVASNECFNLDGNSFEQLVSVLDNNGQPISADYFPVTVNFTVNGVNHSQLLDFDNQVLQISEQWFAANPVQNIDIVVEITLATDKNNSPIQPGSENGMHVRTLFAIPEIEFTVELRKKYYQNEEITAYNDNSISRIERLEPNPVYEGGK